MDESTVVISIVSQQKLIAAQCVHKMCTRRCCTLLSVRFFLNRWRSGHLLLNVDQRGSHTELRTLSHIFLSFHSDFKGASDFP